MTVLFDKQQSHTPMCQYCTDLNPDWNIKNTFMTVGDRTRKSETYSSTSKYKDSVLCLRAHLTKGNLIYFWNSGCSMTKFFQPFLLSALTLTHFPSYPPRLD